MLAIVVSRDQEPKWRRTFATADVNIGHHPDNQLVLDADSVDARHARIVVRDRQVTLVDLSAAGTLVNGKRIRKSRVVDQRDQIAAGAYTLRAFLADPEPAAAYLIRSPIERELLGAIAAGDEASRLVYADWLESQGDTARAEVLRLEHAIAAMSPDAPGFERAVDRLRQVSSGVSSAWRARVAKRQIEGCPAFDFACPKLWSELAATERDGVRHCGSCDKPVYYCASIEEARAHAARGDCVALDVTSPRWNADLEQPFNWFLCDRCDIDVGPGLRHCPRCFGPVSPRVMMRGRMA